MWFSVAILLGRNAYVEAEKASEMRLILEAHRGGNLLDALAAVAKHKFRRTYDFIAYQLVCRTPRQAFTHTRKVLGRDAEKAGILVYIKKRQRGVVQMLHEAVQNVLAGTVSLLNSLIVLRPIQIDKFVNHRSQQQTEAQLLVRCLRALEIILQ